MVIARAVYARDRDISGGPLAGALAFRLFVRLAAFVAVLVAILRLMIAGGVLNATTRQLREDAAP